MEKVITGTRRERESMIHIGCDAHKRYSRFAAVDSDGQLVSSTRVEHVAALYRGY